MHFSGSWICGMLVCMLAVAGESGSLRWENSDLENQPMLAVLAVIADEYASEPHAWNLPGIAESAERFLNGLREVSAIDEHAVRVLRGRDVHRQAIERAIEQLASIASKCPLTLLVYWTGHGWTQEGQLHLMTHFTAQEVDPVGNRLARWRNTIPTMQLHGWIAQARIARKRNGGMLEAVCIYQVCRPEVLLPSDPVPHLAADLVWQLYSVPEGRFAPAPLPGRPDAFTQAWVECLRRLAERGNPVRVADMHRELTAVLKQWKADPPVLNSPRDAAQNDGPLLFLPSSRISFEVAVVDALTQAAPIAQADINLSGLRAATPHGLARLDDVSIGSQHRLVVSAPGYVTRTETLTITRRDRGRRLVVPLYPGSLIVRGSITDGLATVEARGNIGTLRHGVHRVSGSTDALGNFVLQLPLDAANVTLVFHRSGQTILEIPLPLVTGCNPDGQGNRVLNLGLLTPQKVVSDRLERLIGLGNSIDDAWQFVGPEVRNIASEPEPDLPRGKAELWASAMQAISQNQPEVAAHRLRAVLEGCPPEARQTVARRLALVRAEAFRARSIQETFAAADALIDFEPLSAKVLLQVAFARALRSVEEWIRRDWELDTQRRVVEGLRLLADQEARRSAQLEPALLKRLGRERVRLAALALRRCIAEQRHAAVIDIALTCRGAGWELETWPAVRDEDTVPIARELLRKARLAAIESNDERSWAIHDQWLQLLAPWHAAIRDELVESQAERLPISARRAWQESRRFMQEGPNGWSQAFEALNRAEEAGLTNRYLLQADWERRRLALELYLQDEAEAGQFEAEAHRLPPGSERDAKLRQAIAIIAASRARWPDACDRMAAWMSIASHFPEVQTYRRTYEQRDARWRDWRRLFPELKRNDAARQHLEKELPSMPHPERWFVRSELHGGGNALARPGVHAP